MLVYRPGLAVVLVLALSVPAHAKVLVFPLSSIRMPKNLKKLPMMLTEVVAEKVRDAGREVEVAEANLDDSASLLGCDPAEISCLETVASTLGASELIFGTVSRGKRPMRAKVELTRFVSGSAPVSQTLSLSKRSVLDLSNEFAGVYGPLIAAQLGAESTVAPAPKPEPEPEPEPAAPPPEPEPETIAAVPPEPSPSLQLSAPRAEEGGISTTTWILGGAGVALTGGGAALLVVASGIADDVDAAPTDTVAQLEDLRAMEKRGRTFNYAGIGMLAGGGALVVTAIVLGLIESSSTRVAVAPWLDSRRAGVSLCLEVF